MALSQDFYGAQDFIWWVGIVEDRFDPTKLGRVRVRIIGVDSFDTALLPRDKLPWAQMVSAVNGSKAQSLPKEGDWVFGFFQDGQAAQIRTILGFFPAVESGDVYTSQTLSTKQKQELDAKAEEQVANAEQGNVTNVDAPPNTVASDTTQTAASTAEVISTAASTNDVVLVVGYRKEDYPEYDTYLAAEQKKHPDDATKAQSYAESALKEDVRAGKVAPKGDTKVTLGSTMGLSTNTRDFAYNYKYKVRVPRYAQTPYAGEPTSSRLARGIIANTGIEFMNNRLVHVCPTDLEIRQRIGANKYTRLILIKVSRAIASALNAILGADPTGRIAWLIKTTQQINANIQETLDVVEKVKDFIKLVVTTIQLARTIIDWILSLPQRFQEMLKGCLERILAIIRSYLTEFIQEELAAQVGGADQMAQILSDIDSLTSEIDTLQENIGQLQASAQFLQSLPDTLPGILESAATTQTNGSLDSIELLAIQAGNIYDNLITTSAQENVNTVSPLYGI